MCGILKMTEDELVHEFVCAVPSHNASHPSLFRNYRSRTNSNLDCMLWEATRATTATLDLFVPIVIGEASVGKHSLAWTWGGTVRPTNVRKTADVFKDRRITSIINIGSGHPGPLSLSTSLEECFSHIALDCERFAGEPVREQASSVLVAERRIRPATSGSRPCDLR
ncbi:hypothetical protein DL96DRAFT_1821081 [Flagelloscypha sp. PMI_526]|nr:hypothetical protein DL96DRAFT_1821081 [Flagelloscypha sp. PMI_526]